MKKFLLSFVACLAIVCANAEDFTWTKSIDALNNANKQAGTVVAVAPSDGSVYVTGTYEHDFSFGSMTASNPDEMPSGYIAKYSSTGEELWVVTLYGAATVTAATVDDDATLYVTGEMKDDVEITPVAGDVKTINSPAGVFSAFVLRISADGALEASTVIKPSSGVPSGKEDWSSACEITPRNIVLCDNKVFVAVNYTGNVSALGWQGSYSIMYGAYMDNSSCGLFSLDENLTTPTSVATIQMTGIVASESQSTPRGFNITSQDGVVYAGFFGSGKLTLTTQSDSKDFVFTIDDDGNTEFAFVCVAFEESTYKTYQYDAPPISNMYGTFNIAGMGTANGNLYMAGTYKGVLPFDNTKQSSEEDEPNHYTSDDMFATSISLADMSVNWAWTSGVGTKSTSVVRTAIDFNGYTHIDSKHSSSNYSAVLKNNGTLSTSNTEDAYDAIGVSEKGDAYLYRNGTSLDVCYKVIDPTIISSPTTATESNATEIFTINGVLVNKADAPGLYLFKTADGVRKVMK